MKTPKVDTTMGRLFVYSVEIAVIIIIIHALLNSVGDTEPFGIYNRVYYFGYDIHRYSIIVLFVSFLIHWKALAHLYPVARYVVTSVISVWYVYFSHVLWTTSSLIYRGHAEWRTPLLGTMFLTFLMYWLNIKTGFIKLNIIQSDKKKIFLFFVAQIFGLLRMAGTGFWGAMELCDLGLPGPDPNVNPGWLIWKGVSFWMLYPLLHQTKLKAPLQITPPEFV